MEIFVPKCSGLMSKQYVYEEKYFNYVACQKIICFIFLLTILGLCLVIIIIKLNSKQRNQKLQLLFQEL